ncbi:hypothetical protein [Trichoplusia ni ascovirus 6b]|nr:hypothetical protein [Trichoplusia ni ascovirus 6b]
MSLVKNCIVLFLILYTMRNVNSRNVRLNVHRLRSLTDLLLRDNEIAVEAILKPSVSKYDKFIYSNWRKTMCNIAVGVDFDTDSIKKICQIYDYSYNDIISTPKDDDDQEEDFFFNSDDAYDSNVV